MNRWIVGSSILSLLVAVSCGEDEKPKDGEVGAGCDPSQAGTCLGDLECTARGAGYVCTYAAGADCQPGNADLQNGGCADNAVCASPGDSGTIAARCLLREGAECDPDTGYCDDELTCAELVSGGHRCFGQVILQGTVTDSSDNDPIEAAHVIAQDEEGVAVTDVAESDDDGAYRLPIPVRRDDDGNPVDASFTLRADAQDYQPFPSGIRVALPINASQAETVGRHYVIDNALTAISLIPLPDAERQMISGTVTALSVDGGTVSQVGGILVVANGPDGAFTAITDKSGHFTIFNVPDGDYTVQGYAADIQLASSDVSVNGAKRTGVELSEVGERTTTVSGSIQLVNAPGGAETSVILVVADTFNENAARGEAPRGLRAPRTGAPNVTGSFEITGVPAGNYVVLAAYENDDLVRDPDTNIAGTDFVRITVEAGQAALAIADSFKVTEALGVNSPGSDEPEAVTEAPALVWADDSSEDWYELRVFDAFGNEAWANEMVPSVSGSETVSVPYEGPLETGMYYQFRVKSWRQPGNGAAAPISATEDLRGVFFKPAP
jgi:hypothetical protein